MKPQACIGDHVIMGLSKVNTMKQAGDIRKYAVPVGSLRWICPENIFQFECTSDIEPLKEFIGQVSGC
ncbi:MAG: hypothetical protein AMK74_05895 [Nitrospira bacterium SM23_35]|nr:MAG: hypothetical protein AMK74_05895 [Nitrospira bacterium SM23_35]